jgi:hypothetical protein
MTMTIQPHRRDAPEVLGRFPLRARRTLPAADGPLRVP